MIKKNKRKIESDSNEINLKKQKKESSVIKNENLTKEDTKTEKKVKFSKKISVSPAKKNFKSTNDKGTTNFKKGHKEAQNTVTDWVAFKKQKKELALKRKQSKGSYDVMLKAKKIGEEIRRKALKGGEEERTKLIIKLHNELKGKGHYAKFVLTHDVGRVVQYLLKFGPENVKVEITEAGLLRNS